MSRQSLAVGAEIGVVADSTLVAVTDDIRPLVLAKRTIAEDGVVSLGAHWWIRNCLVDRNKAVSWVDVASTLHTSGAIIPVRAVHALVTYPINVLYQVSL